MITARRAAVLAMCLSLVAGGLGPHVAHGQAYAASNHPFMLVTQDEYPALRARAGAEPWATWRAGAIAKCPEAYSPDTDNDNSPSIDERVRQMSALAGSCSLAYILDEANQSVHRAKLLSLIDAARSDIYPDMQDTSISGWGRIVGASGAFFHLVVGLDVIYPDITAAQASTAVSKLNAFGEFFYANRTGSWTAGRIGGYGIWAVFRCGAASACPTSDPQRARITQSISELRSYLAGQSSPDGVYLVGPNYAGHRLGSSGDRDSKAYYPDVLTKAGYHDFYRDAAYVKYMEHLTGYALTPVLRKAPAFVRAQADATVRAGSHANKNFGDEGDDEGSILMVKDDPSAEYDRESYVRFDLTGYEAGHANVERALLRLPVNNIGSGTNSVQVRAIADDTWNESTITWNNRPTSSTVLASWPSHRRGATQELDVTPLINQILADPSDSKFSVRIVEDTAAGSDNWIQYGSRTNPNYSLRPALVLHAADDPVERDQFTFGDSGTASGALWRSARAYSASRFGPVAAANAGWSLAGVPAARTLPLITAYVLTTEAPRTGTTVPSRIFSGGGAWFYEQSTSSTALAGAMWNATKAADHQHKETNTLHLTAYGEHVLRNSGYNGTGESGGVGAFTYAIVRGRAVVSNTVQLDYDRYFTDPFAPPTTNDHALKHGAGIAEGFTGSGLDYASGDSGAALPNGKHLRNFVFIQPSAGANGYWVVFDEVDAVTSGVRASVAWHPNSVDPQTVTSLTEYSSAVGPDPRATNAVQLSTFLGTAPAAVEVKSGPFGDRSESHQGRFLYAHYGTDSAGKKNIVTVLFPSDRTHAKPPMTRLSGSGYTGARIAHPSGTTDYALESAGSSVISANGAAWRGLATHFRVQGSDFGHYFVRKGRSFTYGTEGFDSPSPMTVYANDKTGQIANHNSGTVNVTFKYPGISGVKLNGAAATVVSAGAGWVIVPVPAGTRTVEFTTVP